MLVALNAAVVVEVKPLPTGVEAEHGLLRFQVAELHPCILVGSLVEGAAIIRAVKRLARLLLLALLEKGVCFLQQGGCLLPLAQTLGLDHRAIFLNAKKPAGLLLLQPQPALVTGHLVAGRHHHPPGDILQWNAQRRAL